MLAMGVVTTIVVLPFALYLESTPVVDDTRHAYMVGTLEWMLRFRSPVLIMPFLLSAIAPLAKQGVGADAAKKRVDLSADRARFDGDDDWLKRWFDRDWTQPFVDAAYREAKGEPIEQGEG